MLPSSHELAGMTVGSGYCVAVCMDKLIQALSGKWLNNALPLARMSELSEGWAHPQQGFDNINHLAND